MTRKVKNQLNPNSELDKLENEDDNKIKRISIIDKVREQEDDYFKSRFQFTLDKLLKDLDLERTKKDSVYRGITSVNHEFEDFYHQTIKTDELINKDVSEKWYHVQEKFNDKFGGFHTTYDTKIKRYMITERHIFENRQKDLINNKVKALTNSFASNCKVENQQNVSNILQNFQKEVGLSRSIVCQDCEKEIRMLTNEIYQFCPFCGENLVNL